MAPFDEPPGEGDELPQMEVVADAPAALPRLSIVHLMMWTAATAVAFLPFQLWRSFQAQSASSGIRVEQSAITTLASAVHGIAAGAFLFVSVAVVLWRSRGNLKRLQPGHWLAFKGSLDWVASAVMWMALYAVSSERITSVMLLVQLPQFTLGLASFAVFIWLALRSVEPRRWRWTYAVFAIAPGVGTLLAIVLTFSILLSRAPAGHMMGRGAAQAVQAAVLLIAIAGDLVQRSERHWSHWLASIVYLITLSASAVLFLAYALFPQLLNVQ